MARWEGGGGSFTVRIPETSRRFVFQWCAAAASRSEPGVESGVRHVHAAEVVAVHLIAEVLDGRVDEERGMRAAGAAPHDVRWGAIVPRRGFGEDAAVLGGGDQVGADVVEALGLGGGGALLSGMLLGYARASIVGEW